MEYKEDGSKPSEKQILVYYAGKTKDVLEYEDIFLLDADELLQIEYPGEWTKDVGSLNGEFRYGASLEFLCRLVEKKGKCYVNFVMPEKACKGLVTEDDGDYGTSGKGYCVEDIGMVYAYLIRRHMDKLRARQTLDGVFQGVCKLMQEKNCFAEFKEMLQIFLEHQEIYEQFARETAPFLVLRGDNTCGGVLRQFADDLTESLARNGQAVIEYDGDSNGDKEDLLQELEKLPLKGVVGFQARALEIPYFRKLRGMKFQFWFDNPFSFSGVLRDLPDDYCVLCQDGDHAEWIKKYYHTNAVQFPPGGIERIPDPNAVRDVDVVFIGRFFADESDKLSERQRDFYDFLLRKPSLNFEQAVLEMLEKGMITYPDSQRNIEETIPDLLLRLKPACRAVVGHFRNKVVETILNAGIPLRVYGEDWFQYDGKGKELLEIRPEIPMKDSMRVFERAKVALNVMSWYKAGMTERIANILFSGAVCLSDETRYLKEHFQVGDEIVLYRLEELEKLPEIIRGLLQDEKERNRIAWNGYQRAKRELGWDQKAMELIKLVEKHEKKA